MKTIGLIGGMSWESSAQYYRIINQTVRDRLGGVHSARNVMVSVDFGEIERLQHEGRWADLAAIMVDAARQTQRGGADLLLICTNTMHRLADEVQAAVTIPVLHIADATAERINADGGRQAGLLGTAFTMEQDFYVGWRSDTGSTSSSRTRRTAGRCTGSSTRSWSPGACRVSHARSTKT